MVDRLKTGEKVRWASHGGEAHGKVTRKVTAPAKIKSHKVAATRNHPQYIVVTAEGKRAADKPSALNREK